MTERRDPDLVVSYHRFGHQRNIVAARICLISHGRASVGLSADWKCRQNWCVLASLPGRKILVTWLLLLFVVAG